ncbi:MAG: hypothetical protein IKX10_01990 [Lachnospiraceae bacterium]|nr:hypothetical protein [Lachnospiraceae bacterium]
MNENKKRRLLSLLLVVLMLVMMLPVEGFSEVVDAAATITTQPADKTASPGTTATFTVAATGTGTLTYQWQSRKNESAAWSNSGQSGAKTKTLSVAAIAGLDGWQFRCIVTDGNGQKATSRVATLYINVPKITTQPKSTYADAGTTAKFTVAATGTGTIKYQWQSRKDSSATWSNSGQNGAKTKTLSVATLAGLHGWQFRCIVTDGNGNTTASNAATLYVKPGFVTQPKDVSVAAGDTATFTVVALGKGTLKYQWQLRVNATSAWIDFDENGSKTATLSGPTMAEFNGWQFRCIVTDANGQKAISDVATMNIIPKITSQPTNQMAAVGETAKFTVAATGTGTLKYQWQSRKNSSSAWSNSGQNGAKTKNLSVAVISGLSGWQFRCVVIDGNGQKAYSDVATVTIKAATTNYVTYKQFGAKGDGKTNDYAAIVATHAYANEHNLPVKADKGAVYYVDKMDASNPKGAIIKTNTDWTGAEFFIDDSKLKVASYSFDKKDNMSVTFPEGWDGKCFLFTIEPSVVYKNTWINYGIWWRLNNGKWTWYYDKDKQPGDIKIYIGLDPGIGSYSNSQYVSNPTGAINMKNKTFSKDTTKLEGSFSEKALYSLRTESTKRWGRFGWEGSNSSLIPQEECVIVDTDGKIDPISKLQWDWDEITEIQKSYIDDKQLTVKGGKFTTKVNTMWSSGYIYRGISIERSNVLLEGVEHYLTGEEAEYSKDSFGFSTLFNRNDVFARYGAPYQGFFRLDHCAYVTLKDCVFSNRHRVFYKYVPSTGEWRNDSSTASYDFYAEYCVGITLDGCKSAKTIDYEPDYVKGLLGLGPKVDPVYDVNEDGIVGIMDDLRWGVTGTNYCKSLVVQNGCEINRIDAHKGTYGLTVTDSTLGHYGVAVVGFGKLKIENSKIYSDYLVNLRRDFGSAWYGDVEINNVYWNIGEQYSPSMIFASYLPDKGYGYDTIDSGKKYPNGDPYLYYSQLPTNITISNLTIDARGVTNRALFTSGLAVYESPFLSLKKVIDDKFLMDRTQYMFPLKPTETIQLSNITMIKNPMFSQTTLDNFVLVRPHPDYHTEYFFDKTQMNDITIKLITQNKK